MTKRLLVLLLLSASILLYRGADLVQWLRGVPEASSFGRVDLRDGRMVVLAVPPEDLDGRPTAAARIGLKVDDAVVAFERADGARVSMTGLNLVGATMKSLPRSGGGAMIVLRKEGNAEREVRLPLPARQRPGPISVATRLAVNAGHNPPFLLRAGTTVVSRLRPTGMALGFDQEAVYAAGRETLATGDILLAFTDGLTEALNEAGEEFGDARAAGLLVGNRHLGATELQRVVTDELQAFCGRAPQHDDVTIVVARVT